VPVVMSSGATPVEIIPGHRESHSGIERKPFAFPPESLFAFSQESCSSSPRNRFHVHPGIPFALPRNPHSCDLLGSEGFNSYEFDYIALGWTPLLRQSAVATPAVE
jgi:hypothetical protein